MDIENFAHVYDLTEVYSNLKQSGLDNNDNYKKNRKKLAKAERNFNNNPNLTNLEKPAIIKRYSDKYLDKNVNPHSTI